MPRHGSRNRHARGACWYGSRLSIGQARAPHNNATGPQVTAAVLAGLVRGIENPRAGVVEADELEHDPTLQIAGPYLGAVAGVRSDRAPLLDRETLVPEDVDHDGPWQARNIRVG